MRGVVAITAITGLIATALALAGARPRSPTGRERAAPSPRPEPPPAAAARFRGPELENAAAYIPAQCYARTRDEAGGATHDGCFVCHQESRPPNFVNDADVQTELSFASYATKNRWTNLTSPPPPASLDDQALLGWVRTSNYFDAEGKLVLAEALARAPAAWDTNHDGRWNGYVPDCFFRLDDAGFDTRADGTRTGWRAYASTPTPGAFMPTNGSFGDTLIRLPEPYRQDASGRDSDEIYRINLAIVEAYLTRRAVPIARADERALGSDLDGDGKLGSAARVAFVWPPVPNRPFHYVGKAAELDAKQDGWPVAGSFPRGTELLHSVRYLDVVSGHVQPAARMKELRYMRKLRFLDYGKLDQLAQAEAREKLKSPDKLKHVFADAERGVTTGVGWIMQGFIESADGSLRPQNVEETTACIGCHGGVGATSDASFSFARKLPPDAFRGGWFHPSQHGLEGEPEPRRADGEGEYAHYLRVVGGGDDFRSNDEARAKFFRADGSLDPARLQQLSKDVSQLLLPSPGRALALDRAYVGLVRAQRFERGRDVTVGAPPELSLEVIQDAPTGISVAEPPSWKRAALADARAP